MSEGVNFQNQIYTQSPTENNNFDVYRSNDMNDPASKITKLTEENNELKVKIIEMEKKERLRGVYQILADLNVANRNIKDLSAKLAEREFELNLLRANLDAVSGNNEQQKINSELSQKISEYEKAVEHLNKKVDYLLVENSKANEIVRQKDQRISDCEAGLNNYRNKINEADEHLRNHQQTIQIYTENQKNFTDKFREIEDFKTSLISELEEKNNVIYSLQQQNITIKREINELSEFKEQTIRNLNTDLECKMNEQPETRVRITTDPNEPDSPNRSNFENNLHRKLSSENFGLAENLKDDLQTLYTKSLRKIETLGRDNEKLNIQLIALKDEHKIEVMRLSLTVEELMKVAGNATNSTNLEESEAGKVSSIVKNIQSKINETTIEELKKEKIGYLETITKLKLQIEALENANNMDNLSDKYLQTETFLNHMSPGKHSPNKKKYMNNNAEDNKESKENKEEINMSNNKENNIAATHTKHVSVLENEIINVNELMEKNQNEIRERERKIEYLLQILEEKNNLIEQLRDSDKITSTNHSIEAKETLEFLQFTNENLLKEIEEKNAKIKKLNKDHNNQIAKYELLQADFLELQEKENEITVYTDEIELLKNKNKEYETLIEKMNKELNVKSNTLLRKEKEVNSLKADRANTTMNKSLLDGNNKSLILDINNNNQNNIMNGSIIKDPKFEFLNNSLNEIRDLKDKLKQNNLNRSMRSRRGNSNDSALNNNSLLNSNNSILINTTNQNIPRVFFEEDPTTAKKKINKINNSLYSMNNSLAADGANFNLGNISKINLNDVDAVNNEIEAANGDINEIKENKQNKENQFTVNRQALFVSENASNVNNDNKESKNDNNNYFSIGSNYNTNNILNNLVTYENYNTNPNSVVNTNQNYNSNATYSNINNNDLLNNKEVLNSNFHSVPVETQTLSLNSISNNNIDNNNNNLILKKDYADPNIRIIQSIEPQDILQSQDYWDQIFNWVANSLQREKNNFFFRKIFKATVNGFNSASFYNRVDGKTPTLVILRNNFGKIIGGFTSIAWKTPVNSIDFLEDPSKSGFLFSCNLGKKYDLKENAIAVCHSIGCGPVFGLNDLEVVENADKNYNYFSNVGTSYKFDDTMEDFYGAAKYLVEDYEAFEILLV